MLAVDANAQTVELLTSGTKTSLRGLSVVDEKIVWASGSNGRVARSIDGGISWKWITVKGFEKTDFRDIEAFDSNSAIIMGIAAPAYLLKTTDAGETWRVVYENAAKEMFLDAMDFSDRRNGVVIGDPVKNTFFIARTNDGGNTWKEVSLKDRPLADSGEACFASSGTNIKLARAGKFYFVSGGLRSRMFVENRNFTPPLLQGRESGGANSIALKNRRIMIIAGGDFNFPDSISGNCAITFNKGRSWALPDAAPHGYRSCVEYIDRTNWIACGLNGIDYSPDDGETWLWISREGFHVCRKAKKGNAVFFAGSGGKIGKLHFQ